MTMVSSTAPLTSEQLLHLRPQLRAHQIAEQRASELNDRRVLLRDASHASVELDDVDDRLFDAGTDRRRLVAGPLILLIEFAGGHERGHFEVAHPATVFRRY